MSYVVSRPGQSTPSVEDVLPEDDWNGVGHVGVLRVQREEVLREPGCEVRVMPPKHPGYDLEVWRNGAIIKYIEVKSIVGDWGERGVGMTATQFKHAMEHPSESWLYVVEQVHSGVGPITRIANPALRVTRFQFDHGWKGAASA